MRLCAGFAGSRDTSTKHATLKIHKALGSNSVPPVCISHALIIKRYDERIWEGHVNSLTPKP